MSATYHLRQAHVKQIFLSGALTATVVTASSSTTVAAKEMETTFLPRMTARVPVTQIFLNNCQ